MSYIGQGLPADVFSGFTTDSFTGDGSATTFTLSKAPFSEDGLIVVINNVIQKPTTNFTVSGTTLTIVGTAVASSDVIYAIHTSGAVPSTLASKVDVNGVSDAIILDADADTTISADTDDQIDFKTGGTDRLKVQSTSGNNVVVADGLTLTDGNLIVASGHGIDFSATSDSSVGSNITELLSDYEEGTFTIGVSCASGGAASVSATYSLGQYQLIGNQVHVKGYVICSSLNSGSGNVTLTGLPFTVQNNYGYYNPISIDYAQGLNITAGRSLGGYFVINTTTAWLGVEDATTGHTALQGSELSDDGGFMFQGHYTIGG